MAVIIASNALFDLPLVSSYSLAILLMMFVFLSFFLYVTKSGKVLIQYIRAGFVKNYNYSITELKNIAAVIKNLIKITHAAGGIGVVIGFITFLYNYDGISKMGPPLAIISFSLLYSIALSYFVFFPVRVWAEGKIGEAEQ
jgi:flagellar motor component MotA